MSREITGSKIQELKALLDDTFLQSTSAADDSEIIERIQQCQKHVDDLSKFAIAEQHGILDKFCLDGQVALVTGGGQGIGRGIAHGLGEAGCKVAVCDIDYSKAQVVVAELQKRGITSTAIKVDVCNKEEVEGMVQKVLDTFGELHIAVNNAGISTMSRSEEISESDWKRILDVNLNGVFFCCQAEAKHMLHGGYGKIINIASSLGHITPRPPIHVAHYASSKAAVIHLTRTLGAEWACSGIRVNCISPSWIETPLTSIPEMDKIKTAFLRHQPVGSIGQVDDLIGAMIYLASPVSNYMTGSELLIDGGETCW